MNRTFFIKATTVATLSIAAVAAAGTTAGAQNINFVGSVNIQNAANPENLLLDFLAGASRNVGGTPDGTVLAEETIDPPFAPLINTGTQGVIRDLTVSSTGVLNTPVNPFVTIGGYTFTLNSSVQAPASPFNFGPIQLVDNGNGGSSAQFSVNGAVTGAGLAANSTYRGIFTAQFANLTAAQVFNTINTGGQLRSRSFSAEFTVTQPMNVVPEPSTYALLATDRKSVV